MTDKPETDKTSPSIRVLKNGAYLVRGKVPLVHKIQVVSEYGEPLTWKKEKVYETKDSYILCRCGRSATKPFCDGEHKKIGFDGTETADTRTNPERARINPRGQGVVIKKDAYLCMNSGYCGNRLTNIDRMTAETAEPQVRAEIIAMIERCPAGVYTYSMTPGEEDIEPDLPMQIATTTEITSEGPIEGSLWVTGWVPVERSDGEAFETRNRVTLCNCGHSRKKPLCDGRHRQIQERELRLKREKGS